MRAATLIRRSLSVVNSARNNGDAGAADRSDRHVTTRELSQPRTANSEEAIVPDPSNSSFGYAWINMSMSISRPFAASGK